ncbi:peptide-methionine (S)-S-oxide reductase [Candidatus Woesearchaeota archaeon]|nr:peptide-methionine (S)-S-oxide reductase [Candidatus Woesearchaeota archaeon]
MPSGVEFHRWWSLAFDKSHQFNRSIVTEISSATAFYPAEDYHQQYLAKRGLKTCRI